MNVKEEKLEENLNINSQANNQEQGENLVSPKNSTETVKEACSKRSEDKEKDKGASEKESHAATTRKEEAECLYNVYN